MKIKLKKNVYRKRTSQVEWRQFWEGKKMKIDEVSNSVSYGFHSLYFLQEKQPKSQRSDIENIYFYIISPHEKNSYVKII